MFAQNLFFFGNFSGATGGSWTPADLPGIENWFKSDTGVTLSGSNVSAWGDSLTSKSVTQGPSANQPTFTASNSDFNNLPTLDFTNEGATPVYLVNNTDFVYSDSLPLYCFVIARKTASQSFASAGGGSDANIGGGAWSINIADDGVQPFTGALAGGYLNKISGTTLNTTILAGVGITSTDAYTYFNGSSSGVAGSYSPNANPWFNIGAYDAFNSPGYNFTGSIAEMIITRGSVLSGTDLSNLWNYVQTKYAIPSYDPDAQAYIDAVIAAGGSLTSTEEDAVNTLFVGLKASSLYSELNVLYLFLGGNAAASGLNAIRTKSAFDIDWYNTGDFTFNDQGVTNTGSGYGDTNYNPTVQSSPTDTSWGIYQTAGNMENEIYSFGAATTDTGQVTVNNHYYAGGYVVLYGYANGNQSNGFASTPEGSWIATFGSSNIKDFYRNGVASTQATAGGISELVNVPYFLFTLNLNGSPYNPFTGRLQSFFTGNYLTQAQAEDIDAQINTFQTALGRNLY